MHKLARVVSYLAAAEQRPIQGVITRAFALPDLALARAVLLQIHTQLRLLSCAAARRLLQDLARSMTFHQSGVYDRLSDSLRGTQRVVRTVQQQNRRVRGNWLPPTSHRALFALLLPEMEVRMHRLAHASVHPRCKMETHRQ